MTQLEIQIHEQLYGGSGDAEDAKEFASFISTHWIKEIEQFGFNFIEYGYAHLRKSEAGIHCLVFDQDAKKHDLWYLESDKINKDLDAILTRDDDSQPSANYRIYLGTLWVFIPYQS